MPNIKTYENYIDIAAKEALRSPMTYKLACIIINRGRIVSLGHNKYSRRTQLSGKWSLHAEMDALNKVRNVRDLNGSTMIIVRVDRTPGTTNEFLNAKPCNNCRARLIK